MSMHSLLQADSPQRLFLTGGSGYLGRNLLRHFAARGVPVVALARSAQAAATVSALGAIPFQSELLGTGLAAGMQGCDALVHAAADLDHGWGGASQRRTNLDGTRHVFACAREAGIARAVHIGSESALLDGSPLVDAREDHPYPRRPAGAYSRTKGEAERIALSFAAPGLDVMVVRPRFIWGRDDTTALPQLLAAARGGKLAWIDGGNYRTSTTHVANACEGIDRALRKGRSGEIYFITDGEPQVFRAFISGLLETQGVAAPDKTVPRGVVRALAAVGGVLAGASRGRIKPPVTLQEYAAMAVEVTLDGAKARRELGYRPVISIGEGLAEMRATLPSSRNRV
jgi:nucleoside-diphosphate-sugar epimerase